MRQKFVRDNQSSCLSVREEKWHQELNISLSTSFWNQSYRLTASIKKENRIKWLQYQIVRKSLYTNYRVNKFNNNESPFCTFCLQDPNTTASLERISHLFVDCEKVKELWTLVGDWLRLLGTEIPISKNALLFGIHDQDHYSVPNYVILYCKYYIWVTKKKQFILNLHAFKKYLFSKLDDLKNAYLYEKNSSCFDKWILIYNDLSACL